MLKEDESLQIWILYLAMKMLPGFFLTFYDLLVEINITSSTGPGAEHLQVA